MKRGFSLIEVLFASIILTLGSLAVLALFSQSYQRMTFSTRFETAQRVLNYFEMVHPVPAVDQVTTDPLDDDRLNIPEARAESLAEELELDLSPDDRDDIEGYTVARTVDDIDDEELDRNGGIYTLRTTVRWGGNHFGGKKEELSVVRLWWKSRTGGGDKSSSKSEATK